MIGIVHSSQVGEDGEAFHDSEAALVVVDDDGNATVGPELGEPYAPMPLAHTFSLFSGTVPWLTRLLLYVLHDIYRLPERIVSAAHVLANNPRDAITRCSPSRMLP